MGDGKATLLVAYLRELPASVATRAVDVVISTQHFLPDLATVREAADRVLAERAENEVNDEEVRYVMDRRDCTYTEAKTLVRERANLLAEHQEHVEDPDFDEADWERRWAEMGRLPYKHGLTEKRPAPRADRTATASLDALAIGVAKELPGG